MTRHRIAAHRKKWAAAIMILIQSARLNGHDLYTYLKDVITRLPFAITVVGFPRISILRTQRPVLV